jgi:hypothetical protein
LFLLQRRRGVVVAAVAEVVDAIHDGAWVAAAFAASARAGL